MFFAQREWFKFGCLSGMVQTDRRDSADKHTISLQWNFPAVCYRYGKRTPRLHSESEDCARRKAFLPKTAAPTASSAAPTGPPGGRYGSTAGPHVCAMHAQGMHIIS